ncbi:MAG TPA: hypothetical protein VFT88_05110 [Acidobacteriaceae bacterium]|nr:hypothetical protein [Acidobacteriaceae bacterium]
MAYPSKLTKAVIERICARLATGEPLTQICRGRAMPTPRSVRTWMREHEWVALAIAHAREIGFDAIAEDCIEIADAKRRTKADPQRDKLRVWTRLQLLAKWDPKRYGEKVQHGNDPDNPLPAPQFIINPIKPVSGE